MGQRCQISGYEHLEDVNVINANQILLAGVRGSGGRDVLRRNGAKTKRRSASEAMKGVKVAGMCPRDINRHAVKEVAHAFSSLSLMALVFHQTAHTQGLRD